MHRRLLPLAAAALLTGCGDDTPPMPTNTKTMPTVVEQYERRSLTSWRALGPQAPAEERAAQAWALGILEKDPLQSVDVLLRLLRDEDPSVQLAAVVATGRLMPASPAAAERLVELLRSPQEPVRRHARLAVGTLGAAALPALQGALKDESVRVRWAAVSAFGDLGAAGAPAVGELATLATKDPNASIRRQAPFSLSRMGSAGIAACVGLMRKGDSVVRSEIAAALVRGGKDVVMPMAALLGDKDEDLAARAAGVLYDLGPSAEPAMDALVEALRREGPVRFNAAEALIIIGAPARERLKVLEKSKQEDIAAIARYILDGGAVKNPK